MILISSQLCRYLITQSHLVYVAHHTTAVQSDVCCIVTYVRSPKYVPGIQFDMMINSSLPAVSCLICMVYFCTHVLYDMDRYYLGTEKHKALRRYQRKVCGMVCTHVSYTPARVIQI